MGKIKQLSAGNALSAFLLAFSMLLFSGFAVAQTNKAADKSSLRSWTGVWTFVDEAVIKNSSAIKGLENWNGMERIPSSQNAAEAKSTVEIRLTPDGKGLEISRTVPNQPDVKEVIIPDGSKRPMTASNCSGWQSAKLVPEAGLIISSSEMNCKDTGIFATTSVKMILAADKMVDILALKAAGQTRLATRRLTFDRDLAPESDAAPGYVTVIDRMGLAEPWNLDTVIQLSKNMETQVLEATLLEKKVRLNLNSASLKELKNAKAPQGIIDLLVALAYPDKFHIEKNGTVELRPWIDSSSSGIREVERIRYSPRVDNYPGMLYNCYSINGFYSGYPYSGYPGGCYSYYSPLWWDYPVYVPNNVVIVPGGSGGSSGSSGFRPDNGRLTAGTGYVQIEPQDTGRHARPREGNPSYSGPAAPSYGSYTPSPSYSGSSSGSYSTGSSSGSSGSYSTGSSSGSSSGVSASPGGYSSGGGASPGGYSSGSGSSGTAVPR